MNRARLRFGARLIGVVVLFSSATLRGQTYTVLHSYTGADGANPRGRLLQATDGSLYGTTKDGGSSNCADGCGTVFRIGTNGGLTTIQAFPSWAKPGSGLIQASDGNLYGTTEVGGDYIEGLCNFGCGTVFGMDLAGKLVLSVPFHFVDGCYPLGEVFQGADGNLYGTTAQILCPLCGAPGTAF